MPLVNKYLKILFVMLSALVFVSAAYSGGIYKYKDASGKWVFSDKDPKKTDSEKIEYKNKSMAEKWPTLRLKKTNKGHELYFENPFYAPLEVELWKNNMQFLTVMASPGGLTKIAEGGEVTPTYKFRWWPGDPKTTPENVNYLLPFHSRSYLTVTQGFNGRYSHTSVHSKHAVDIAMHVGTDISAARDGIVVRVKDNYHMGGWNQYFLDKANFVDVLHEDGTYATYAHILMSTATVKPGDKVKAGDKIARSGSSGFSTGPHLHFVIRRNVGKKIVSVPFKFVDRKGKVFTPAEGMEVQGAKDNF